MYLITLYDGSDDTEGTVIHTPYTSGEKLSSGVIKLVGDGIDSFDFSINPSNPAWNNIRPLRTLIKIVDARSGKEMFDGRILKPTQTMTADGMFHIKYIAESKLAYLHDSTQRHGEYNNMTVRDFLQAILSQHNRQVEPHKQFEVGEVTVTTSTDNIYRFLGYEKTWEAIKDKLIDRLGGHIRLRDGKYIDYLASVGELKETPIRLRTNLKDMQKEIDPTDIITRLVPLGARIETEEGGSGISEPRVTVETVNNGLDYIDDEDLIAEFGIIEGSIIYDDVNVPSTVLLRGRQFFQAQRAARVSYDVSAPNLNLIDTTFEELTVDDYFPIDNPVFAIDEPIQVIGKDIDIFNPQLNKLQIGDKHKTLSEYQVQANKQMMTVRQLEERVDSLGSQNLTLRSDLKDAKESLETIQQRLIDVELDDLPEELQEIGQQLIAIQATLDDLDIPEYDDATPTSSGLMSASDKSKLDAITESRLLTVEDKTKLDNITVTEPIDLNDILARLEALEGADETDE